MTHSIQVKAIIGYTGFIGSNLVKQTIFHSFYNSKNIAEIKGEKNDLLVCAASSGVKWKANKNPKEDLRLINNLIKFLKETEAEQVVHISTADVYKSPMKVDEDTKINSEESVPYGRHRYYMEEFMRNHFKKTLIMRLPTPFGVGLKKGFIYDLINNDFLCLTHKDSHFQYYYLENLWKDVKIALDNSLSLINITSEPISSREIARECFNIEFTNVTREPPVYYDMRSKYARLYGGSGGYMYTREKIYREMREYLKTIGYCHAKIKI